MSAESLSPPRDSGTGTCDRQAFIRTNTRVLTPPLVPEIRLHLAEESLPIWHRTEEELGQSGLPPPFWAFAWSGGQALARYLIDNPAEVAGKRVLDLGAGSGLTAIAAMRAGAAHVLAADIDAFAAAAIALNAEENRVQLEITSADLLADSSAVSTLGAFDVVIVGDLFYERELAARTLALIADAVAHDCPVLVGDPGRSYFAPDRFDQIIAYQVPVSRELEDSELKRTAVWRPRSAKP